MVRRVVALLLSFWVCAAAAQTTAGVMLHGESAALRDGLFALPAAWRTVPLHSGDGAAYLRSERHGLVFEGQVQWRGADGTQSLVQGRINELYADFSAAGFDFTVGKKVFGSGIGYGFRPLDVIEREDRFRLFTGRLEGVPMLAAERFDADSAVSLIYFNRLDVGEAGVRRSAHELVLRDYRLWGDLETVMLLHLHERLGAAFGGGFTWVGGEHLELHGAVLYQPRLLRRNHVLLDGGGVLATADPWHEVDGRNDGRALLGLTWTGLSGITVIAEAWHDGGAMTRTQWQALFALAAQQRALLGSVADAAVYGNLAWDATAYQSPSLLRDNLLLHVAYDGERFDPYFDLLGTPADHGYVATGGVDWQPAQGLSLRGGARVFGGPADSAYRQLPERAVIFLELHSEMVW